MGRIHGECATGSGGQGARIFCHILHGAAEPQPNPSHQVFSRKKAQKAQKKARAGMEQDYTNRLASHNRSRRSSAWLVFAPLALFCGNRLGWEFLVAQMGVTTAEFYWRNRRNLWLPEWKVGSTGMASRRRQRQGDAKGLAFGRSGTPLQKTPRPREPGYFSHARSMAHETRRPLEEINSTPFLAARMFATRSNPAGIAATPMM